MNRSHDTGVITGLDGRVWSERWCLPHESAFNRLQKYAWANLARANDIARDLFGTRASSPNSARYRDLLWADWIELPATLNKLQTRPHEFLFDGFLRTYGSTWPKLLASAGGFRYCCTCLSEGFHSTLFQIEGLLKCPRHSEPLHARCRQCDTPTVRVALLKESFETPFHCGKCGRPLAGTFDPRVWFRSLHLHREIKRALRPLDRWLKQLEQYPHQYKQPPLGQLSLAGEYASETQALVSFEIAQQLVPLDLPQDQCGRARRPLSYYQVVTRPFVSSREFRGVNFLPRHAIYKSIRRYILRTHCFAHRRCLSAAYDAIGVRRVPPGIREVIQDDDVCPIAAAFRRWDLLYMIRLEELRSDKLGAELAERDEHDSSDALFATEILAHFYACAATAYEYDIWSRSRNPNYGRFDASLSRLMPYNSLRWHGERLWRIRSKPLQGHGLTTYLVVSGSSTILKNLDALSPLQCIRGKRRRRSYEEIVDEPRRAQSRLALRRPVREMWRHEQVRPYESALSVILKYLNDNRVSTSNWQQLIFASDFESNSLLTGQGVIQPRPEIAAGEAIVGGTLRSYGARWRCGLTISERVRQCPECRAQGYHCIFFQIQNLRSCPMHGSELIDYCANCGANTPSYDLPGSWRALRADCRRCHAALFSSISPGHADPHLTAVNLETRLRPLADWIGRAELTHRPDPLWHTRLPVADLSQPCLPPGFNSPSRFTFSMFS